MKRFIYKWVVHYFLRGCSNFNPLSVRKKTRTKAQARAFFKKLDAPHAKGCSFILPFSAMVFAKKFGFPLTIKPNVSGYSRGAHFPLNSYWEVFKASILVKVWWPVSIIETCLVARNYRVLISRDEVISIIERFPPYVTGDGSQSIGALIDAENKIILKRKMVPVMYLIKKNAPIRRYLKKQNLDFTSIPKAGQRIYLHNKVALKMGSTVEVWAKETLHPKNRQVIDRVLAATDANILGIDIICDQGLDIEFSEQKVIFLELNSRPYIKMHNHPRHGEPEDLSAALKKLEQIPVSNQDIF